jgi:hypothetical protein
VHAIGVCLGLIGAVTIVVIAVKMERIEITPILIYVIGLVTMLALSAAYNMWPVSPAKWVLRRFDHSAIYLLIAGASKSTADRASFPARHGPQLVRAQNERRDSRGARSAVIRPLFGPREFRLFIIHLLGWCL